MHQPLSPIQNNSDLAQGPLPIRPSKVRRKLPHVAAELIGWENSDAQDHLVCRCRRFDRDWVRSMGGLARQTALLAKPMNGINAPQRPDCVADDAVSCELVSAPNSLLTGKLTGNFAESGHPRRFLNWLVD